MDEAKVREFLRELTLLSKKHNITIHACGCCNSPWLEETTEHDGNGYAVYASSIAKPVRYNNMQYKPLDELSFSEIGPG